MFDPTQDSTGDHPYRSAPAPRPFDPEAPRVPYQGESRMRLTIASGLAHTRLVVDPAARDLLSLELAAARARPRIQRLPGELALSWRSSFSEWLCHTFAAGNVFTSGLNFAAGLEDLVIVLHPQVEWTLAIRGGLSHVECDLSAGALARLDIAGGASHVRLDLPAPAASVPVRIAGGASHLGVRRPAGVGVALDVAGGLAELRLDERRFEAIGGPAQLETRDVAGEAPRYDLTIEGGACDLAIERR